MYIHVLSVLCALSYPQVPEEIDAANLRSGNLPVVLTPDIKRSIDLFLPWLRSDNKHPFIVVGPEGCGKE